MSEVRMPEFWQTKWEVLQHVKDGRVYMFRNIESPLEDRFDLTPEQREKRHRGGEKIFYHKCNQACQFLACLGLLEAEGEFYEDKCYKITALGSEVAKRKRTNIVKRYVEQVKREMKMRSR